MRLRLALAAPAVYFPARSGGAPQRGRAVIGAPYSDVTSAGFWISRLGNSDILVAVKKLPSFAIIVILASAWIFAARTAANSTSRNHSFVQDQTQQQSSSPQQTQQGAPAQPPSQAGASQSIPAAHAYTGPVVVLDPAHGGTDTGARGENNVAEKDVVLAFAREARGELESQGFRVVMTRNDDSNPSYDDRAATANAYRDAVFISIHVASTGTVGTAHTYYYQYWSPVPANAATGTSTAGAAPGLVTWQEAQRPFADRSHRFGDILQGELSGRFSGSPSASTGIAVRGLRSIEAPAVAVELSSIAVSDPSSLSEMAAPLAASIVHAVQAFHPAGALVTP